MINNLISFVIIQLLSKSLVTVSGALTVTMVQYSNQSGFSHISHYKKISIIIMCVCVCAAYYCVFMRFNDYLLHLIDVQ